MEGTHGNGHSAGNQPSAIQRIYAQQWSFLALFIIIFGLTLYVCVSTGFIPDSAVPDASLNDLLTGGSSDASSTSDIVQTSSLVVGPAAAAESAGIYDEAIGEMPVKITIPALNKTVTVADPQTTNVDTLDNYLSYGAVRYPTSATLGEQGNVIIFGHSSYLPIVHNQAYKTFDGIQNLNVGDQIEVFSKDTEYVYAVQTVKHENASDGDAIPLTTTGYTLTLSTCDSFATTSDRFVVTATLVGSYPLGSQT